MGALGEPIAQRASSERKAREPGAGELLPLRRQAAQRATVALLSSGMAHEARNSLNALAIHLEVLADKLRDERDGRVPVHLERNLAASRNQIRKMDRIVRRFAEFAGGRSEAADLAGVARDAVELCAYHLRRLGTEVAVDLPDDFAIGDAPGATEALVEAVLQVSRAVPGGSLRIEASLDGPVVTLRLVASEGHAGSALDALRPIVEGWGGTIAREPAPSSGWAVVLPCFARGEEPPLVHR